MRIKYVLTTMAISLGLAAGAVGPLSAQAADQKSADKPTTAQSATAIAAAKMELPFPDGEKWTGASEREKLAYLHGIMNMAMAEYQLTGPTPKYRSLVPKMVQALDGVTLRRMMDSVDAYYKANPDQQKRSVFEVIWFEIVAPKTGDMPAVKEK